MNTLISIFSYCAQSLFVTSCGLLILLVIITGYQLIRKRKIAYQEKRPVNLDLRTISFPITAITSILHRISGVIAFALIGILLWLLKFSLSGEANFLLVQTLFDNIFLKLLLWGMLTALLYHILGGIRHLLMDIHWIPETFCIGIYSAYITFILTAGGGLLLGIWLW